MAKLAGQELSRLWRNRAKSINERARMHQSQGHLLPADLRAIVVRDDSRCIYCDRELDYQARGNGDQHAASFDHIVRLTDGGSNTYENVACACRTCNQRNNSASIDDPESEAIRRLRIFLSRKPGDTRRGPS